MGHTIWVDVQGRAADDLLQDNSIMLQLEHELDALSEKLRVAKLSDFYDYSALEEAYAEFLDDAGEEDGGSGEARSKSSWFDPAPALEAVRAILARLAQRPSELRFKPEASRRHWPAALMEELKHCQTVLEKAASQGRAFRFLIVS